MASIERQIGFSFPVNFCSKSNGARGEALWRPPKASALKIEDQHCVGIAQIETKNQKSTAITKTKPKLLVEMRR